MKTVLSVFGTRPEAIKMIPVVKALRASSKLHSVVAVTGQHREMLSHVFSAFDESPDIDLGIMSAGQSLSDITRLALTGVEKVIDDVCPDVVLVHGDTTTALAAAIAAFYKKIPVGHVEAGLRSHNIKLPWPEEFNRITIDSISSFLFAPTETAASNLRRETLLERNIYVTGNTGIDSLMQTEESVKRSPVRHELRLEPDKKLVLVTGHRRESFGIGFHDICSGLLKLASRGDVQIVYPVHLNPQVRGPVIEALAATKSIHLIEPVGYHEMVDLMCRAHFILTDSGGIQEEAPALGKPVLVMRDVTERPEAIQTGVASLVGTNPDMIFAEGSRLIDDVAYYASRARRVYPYGDGQASIRIVQALEQGLGLE